MSRFREIVKTCGLPTCSVQPAPFMRRPASTTNRGYEVSESASRKLQLRYSDRESQSATRRPSAGGHPVRCPESSDRVSTLSTELGPLQAAVAGKM